MDTFLYPLDHAEPVFSQPPGHWRRRGACETLVALASVPPARPEREWDKAAGGAKRSTATLTDDLVALRLGDREGYTAWHYWAHGPNPELDFERLRKLLPAGLEERRANGGELPSHRLLMKGSDDAFESRVKKFKLAQDAESGTDTHWHMLAWHGGKGRIQRLGDHLDLQSIDCVDGRGLTGMMIAAHRGHRKDLDHWLLLGAHPDIRDRAGNTLLHHVARYGDADWYGRILDLGADDTLRNERGQRAKDVLEDRVRHGSAQDVETVRRHWEIAYFHKTHL